MTSQVTGEQIEGVAALLATGGDPAVRAQDDFFRHVNGRWLREHEIPADRSVDGQFHQLRDLAEEHVRAIVEEAAAAEGEVSADTARIAAMYNAFMDTEAVEAAGADPLEADLALIREARTREDLAAALGRLEETGVPGFLGLYVDSDPSDPDRYVLNVVQSGLGLPDPTYYTAEEMAAVREAYRAHLPRQLTICLGVSDADAAALADAVFGLESRLAAGHWDRVRSRDRLATHNPMTVAEWADLLTGFDLAGWAGAQGLDLQALETVVVRMPSFLEAAAQAWREEDLATWKAWLTWSVIRARAPYLHAAAALENFDFYGRTLTGATEQRERWKRGVALVEGALGDAVGRLYVARHFPPESKQRMDELVADLIAAYRDSISSLTWMTPETRARALEKLEAFTPKIGYPVRWRSYDALELGHDLLGNVRAANRVESARELGKLGGPVDRDEWHMTPQTVNAYYNPGMNEIVFPAAILRPPFFDPEASDAANFGGIGAVIGHEIGHGFDDQGSRTDGTGRLVDWWSTQDREEFEKRTAALIEQYNAYSPAQLDGSHHVNGALTIGENIGDLGGLGIAVKAFIAAREADGGFASQDERRAQLRELLTNWAIIWRSKARDERVIQLLTIDPHSPEEFRANGVLRNLDVFAEVFDLTPGDAMWLEPDQRVSIW
ncbi:M13 family metallopeptidase [Serinibacter salmoneus]|uniref:Putative endopeptidase n=1 Tax=Serinibacter salmoneus TaxID=556530 RepID=A0A2A9CZR0_9MICO|nr:M13-type metalloendopeptidase [Serinibacter salmoneus]PFG19938.1 putative endopeptidase [Serinibacter salmoneus]